MEEEKNSSDACLELMWERESLEPRAWIIFSGEREKDLYCANFVFSCMQTWSFLLPVLAGDWFFSFSVFLRIKKLKRGLGDIFSFRLFTERNGMAIRQMGGWVCEREIKTGGDTYEI